ncbi:MAG: peptidoglycan editing factor PgeF [Nevskiaceae bacterium]|jgi:YfiH family protein|nr:peptidoglycan editing factor PgeF [Nevskiaceae bacterium]
MTDTPPFITPDWPAPRGVRALSTLKGAGSFGPDQPANRDRLRTLAGLPAPAHWLKQVHGITVADLDAPAHPITTPTTTPTADAAVTARPGVVCAIQTADCLPVLLAAADASAVGAAHAGWRGLAAGVLEATVAALRAKATPGAQILAWLGPAIGPAHFEVGAEVRDAFLATDPTAADAFTANARGRWQCNLYALASRRLATVGVHQISGGNFCTYADPARFWSHRRDTHAGENAATGRMASLVWFA